MTEQKCYCLYLNNFIDSGLCYDLRVICDGFIKSSVLPNIEIDKEILSDCCVECDHNE